MFERLTAPARQAIVLAHDFARSAGGEPINGAELLVGFARSESSIAGQLLRERSGVRDLEEAFLRSAHETGRRTSGALDSLTAVMAGGAGVSVAQGRRYISSAACLLAILAVESPSANALLTEVGIDPAELVAALRQVDDNAEGGPPDSSSDASWTITIGEDVPEDLRWSPEQS